MRKLACWTLIVGSIAVAGCGGGGSDDAASPLDSALSFLPADAPFAVAIDTDTDARQFKAILGTLDELPFGNTIEGQLKRQIERQAGDLDEIQKALGNEFVVGSTDAKSFVDAPSGKDTKFVGAIQAPDEDAIDDLLEQAGAEQDGEAGGAKIYSSDTDNVFAVKDDMLVVAGSRKELEQAIATHESGDHLTEKDFEKAVSGLPKQALMRLYVDIGQLLQASGDAEKALKAKWVKALRIGGAALSFADGKVDVDLRVNTDPKGLVAADVPIVGGPAAPRVVSDAGQIGIALRDPAHTLEFIRATAAVIDPGGSGSFDSAVATIENRLDLSLEEDILGQLAGDLNAAIDLDGKFGVRAELEDPAEFEQTLAALARVLPELAQGVAGGEVGFAEPGSDDDFYALATDDGKNIVFGVVDGVFVLSNDAEKAGALAAASAAPVRGAKGALVLNADAEKIGRGALDQAKDQLDKRFGIGAQLVGPLATKQLDRLTGSIEASTSGLTGSFTLTLDD